jgi:hypothetical protein
VGLDVTYNEVFVPKGYVSGAPLRVTSTYEGQSFKSLGMFSGTYVYSWGSGDHADHLTINIGSGPIPGSVPEPSTWALMIVGMGLVGLVAFRRSSHSGGLILGVHFSMGRAASHLGVVRPAALHRVRPYPASGSEEKVRSSQGHPARSSGDDLGEGGRIIR